MLVQGTVEGASEETLAEEQHVARSLISAVGNYATSLSRSELPEAISTLLPAVLRSAQQFANVIELAQQMIEAQGEIGTTLVGNDSRQS